METSIRRREQEVWLACDDLWAINGDMKSLTGDAIRERLVILGKSRGSPNEIYKYRKTWGASRGLSLDAVAVPNEIESDPISRAVKMVHEKLQQEATDHIDRLREDFEQALAQKDTEVKKSASVLESVMLEFSQVQRDLESKQKQIQVLDEQLSTEIEVRKAVDRELTLNRSLREQERKAAEETLREVKAVFEQESQKACALERERTTAIKVELDKLVEEKKQLGFDYSEKLTELKTVLYHKDFHHDQLEKKITILTEQLASLSHDHEACAHKIAVLKEECANFKNALAARDVEIALLKDLLDKKNGELRQVSYARKKTELTVSRLRAHIFHTTSTKSSRLSS